MVNQAFSLVSIERLAKYPDVGSSRSSRVLTSINSERQTGSSSVCVWQPTRTHRPLMQKKSCSEESFQKNCFRSTVSEDIVQKTWFWRRNFWRLGRPDFPDIPDVPILQQKNNCFRSTVSEALFQKHCSRKYCSEDLVLKEEFLTTRTSGNPGLPGHPERSS